MSFLEISSFTNDEWDQHCLHSEQLQCLIGAEHGSCVLSCMRNAVGVKNIESIVQV